MVAAVFFKRLVTVYQNILCHILEKTLIFIVIVMGITDLTIIIYLQVYPLWLWSMFLKYRIPKFVPCFCASTVYLCHLVFCSHASWHSGSFGGGWLSGLESWLPWVSWPCGSYLRAHIGWPLTERRREDLLRQQSGGWTGTLRWGASATISNKQRE